jgi:D-inositol-3-phosphate glycosyltransferase
MNALKILILSPAYPLRGGIAASTERLAQELIQEGHEVVIYSFSLQYPSFLFPGKTQYSDDPAPVGLHIRTVLNSINPFNWIWVGKAMANEKPDLVVVRFWLPFMGMSLGTALRVARWFKKKPVRVCALVDNIIPHEKRIGDRFLAQYFVHACDEFVVMSEVVGKDILQFLPASQSQSTELIRYAPHPVYDNYGALIEKSAARRHLALNENQPLVLFFGFIRHYKGLDLLLEALALVPEIHLVVAGECYESWEVYQAIIDKNNLGHRVHLHLDFIPSEQVKYYFSAADLVVQPYRSATQSGISQIAFHFEKPMLATRVGGLPEIIEDKVSGYIVAPEPVAIAAAMRDFFTHGRSTEMSLAIKKAKERFSWKRLSATIQGR